MEPDKTEFHSSPAVKGMGQTPKKQRGRNISMDMNSNKGNEDLVNFLEVKIDEFEKKLDKT